jgi:DNA-binding XRE family transcriptional regulator
MDDLSLILRRWRKAAGLKQNALAALLGVSQAAVSRWENGLDQPSPALHAKIRDMIGRPSFSEVGMQQAIVGRMPGIRALVDLDGMRLLSTSQSFKIIWPEVAAAEGHRFAAHLLDLTRDIYNDNAIMQCIKANEIAMIAAVSDRQISGFGDQAFRHYWAASYKKIGTRHLAEISYEACEPNAQLGLRHILRVDEIG